VRKTFFTKPSLAALAVLVAVIPLSVMEIERHTNQQVSIALVQGGVVHTGLGTFGPPRAVLNKHAEMTLQNQSRLGDVDLVVWPESSSDYDPLKDPASKSIITDVVKTLDKPLLLGANLELEDGRVSNSSLLWSEYGVEEVYQKQRLVPFGEFLPFRDTLVRYTDRALLMPRDFAAGGSPGSITVKNVVIDIAICFEVADDSIILNNAADAGAVIVHTNNATYQHLGQSEQQLLSAKMRALETQRPVLSVSTSGVSAVVAPNGDVEQLLTQEETGLLITKVISTSGSTFAMRVHNLAVIAIFTLGLMVVVEVLYRRRRVKS
jgi:apolipoprotein N-acyltransferase